MEIKEPKSYYTVRFQDCDPFGHLNNARYLDYVISAREDHVREHYQLDQRDYMKKGLGWVIQHHEIMYLKPVGLYEKICIQTSLIGFSEHYVLVEGLITDEAGQTVKAVLWTRLYHVSTVTGEKTKHPDHLMELFPKILNEKIEIQTGLKGRVSQLLSMVVSA